MRRVTRRFRAFVDFLYALPSDRDETSVRFPYALTSNPEGTSGDAGTALHGSAAGRRIARLRIDGRLPRPVELMRGRGDRSQSHSSRKASAGHRRAAPASRRGRGPRCGPGGGPGARGHATPGRGPRRARSRRLRRAGPRPRWMTGRFRRRPARTPSRPRGASRARERLGEDPAEAVGPVRPAYSAAVAPDPWPETTVRSASAVSGHRARAQGSSSSARRRRTPPARPGPAAGSRRRRRPGRGRRAAGVTVVDQGVQRVLESEPPEPHVAVAEHEHRQRTAATVGIVVRTLRREVRPDLALLAEGVAGDGVPLDRPPPDAVPAARPGLGRGLRQGEHRALHRPPAHRQAAGVERVGHPVRHQRGQPPLEPYGIGGHGARGDVGHQPVGPAVVGAQPVAEVPDVGAREVVEERVGRPVAVADAGRHQQDLAGRAVAAPEEGDGSVPGGVVERFDERGAGAGGLVPERLGQGGTGGGVPGGFELPGESGCPGARDRPGGGVRRITDHRSTVSSQASVTTTSPTGTSRARRVVNPPAWGFS